MVNLINFASVIIMLIMIGRKLLYSKENRYEMVFSF